MALSPSKAAYDPTLAPPLNRPLAVNAPTAAAPAEATLPIALARPYDAIEAKPPAIPPASPPAMAPNIVDRKEPPPSVSFPLFESQ